MTKKIIIDSSESRLVIHGYGFNSREDILKALRLAYEGVAQGKVRGEDIKCH